MTLEGGQKQHAAQGRSRSARPEKGPYPRQPQVTTLGLQMISMELVFLEHRDAAVRSPCRLTPTPGLARTRREVESFTFMCIDFASRMTWNIIASRLEARRCDRCDLTSHAVTREVPVLQAFLHFIGFL